MCVLIVSTSSEPGRSDAAMATAGDRPVPDDGGEDLDPPPGYSPRSQRAEEEEFAAFQRWKREPKDAEELGVTGGPRTMRTRETTSSGRTPDRHRRGTGQAPLLRTT